MHRVILHGAYRDHLPARYKRGFYLDFDSIEEFLNGAEQHLPLKRLMDEMGAEFRIGQSVRTARRLTFDEVVHGHFKGIDGQQQIKLHIIPATDGDEITTAMIIQALVQAAIAVAVNVGMNLLFPPEQPDNGTDKRKSMVYPGGVNQQKEGIPLPIVMGDDVLAPMNIIEGGVTTLQTGDAGSIIFYPGAGAQTVQHAGDGGLTGRPGGGPGGGGGGTLLSLDGVVANNGWRELQERLSENQNQLEGDGGSKGGKTMANTMYSSNRIHLLGAVGVGPMGGLVGETRKQQLQNVYINEVPLISGNGVPAFQGIEIDTRIGEPNQADVALTADVESTFNDPMELIKADNLGNPVSYSRATTPGSRTDFIKARLNVILLFTSKKGNQRPETVEVACSTWRQGQPEIHYGTWRVSGKTSEQCQFDLRVAAPPVSPGGDANERWFFKFYRVTPDSTSDSYTIETQMQGWTEVLTKQLTYDGSIGNMPATALLAAAINNAQFGDVAVPELVSRWRGYLCRMPSIYNARTKTHNGIWNGADWQRTWTSNPMYCLHNLAIMERGGPAIPESYFDKYNVKAVAEFCDERINGRPRFTMNKAFTDATVTIDQIRDIAQTFNTYTYFDGRKFWFVPDRAGQPLAGYLNNAGVEDGIFPGLTTPTQDRVNEVIVEWDNPADFFQTATVRVRDEAQIAILRNAGHPNNGVVSKKVYKIGCTNEPEAIAWGRYLIRKAQKEHTSISPTLLIGATGYPPGSLVGVFDWNLAQDFKQGRIDQVIDENTIRMDAPVKMKANTPYKLWAQGPNGILFKDIVSHSTDYEGTDITVSGHGLVAGTMARPVSPTGVQPIIYRVMNIQETEPAKYTMTMQLHDEGKYAYVDGYAPPPTLPWTTVNQEPLAPPAEIKVNREVAWDEVMGTSIKLVLSWPAVEGANRYLLEGRSPTGNMEILQDSGRQSYTIENVIEGTYIFTVKSLNIAGASGQPRVKTYTFSYDDETSDLAPAPVFEGLF